MISQCAGCFKFIKGTVDDPTISAKSLGWKNYHDACAKLEWKRRGISPENPSSRGTSAKEKMADKKTQFRVQCTLIKDGVEESHWTHLLDTLQEAEDYCDIQMAPSEFAKNWTAFGPEEASANSEQEPQILDANTTSRKYVNCTILLMMKNGKSVVTEERIHPLAPPERELSRKQSEEGVAQEAE